MERLSNALRVCPRLETSAVAESTRTRSMSCVISVSLVSCAEDRVKCIFQTIVMEIANVGVAILGASRSSNRHFLPCFTFRGFFLYMLLKFILGQI